MTTIERRSDEHGDVIVVHVSYAQKDRVKQLPGSRWDPHDKVWTMPLSWASCLQLRAMFGQELVVGPELARWSNDEFTRRVQPATKLRTVIDRVPGDWDERLYDFQTAGTEWLRVADGGLLGDDMGMGKTAQILAAVRALDSLGDDALPALVVCPNSVKTGWEKQLKLWKIKATPYVLTGGAAARLKLVERARLDPRAIVIINVESVRLLSRLAPFGNVSLKKCRACSPHGEEGLRVASCEVHPKPLNGFGFKTVILDEAHRCKEPSSKQTRAVWAVGHDPSVKRRWALTGTAVANHVGDLWSIMHFIVPHEYPTKSKFVDRYALQAWNAFGGLDIVGVNPSVRDEFFNILDSRFRRTPKALVLTQLPKVVRATRWVDMVPKQKRAYDDMARHLITRLDSGQILIARGQLVNATRLLQLSSSYCDVEQVEHVITARMECACADLGAAYHLDDCVHREKQRCWCYALRRSRHVEDCPYRWQTVVTLAEPSPKLDAMEEAYDELGGKPVVIAAESRQLIELAAKRFGKRKIPYGLITGSVDEYNRHHNIQRFIAGDLNVMLMTIKAGGTGVDGLQHADTMFCLQRSWSMVDNIQVDARVDRIGSEQHSSVTIVDFVTRDSVEAEAQHPRLAEKYERLEEINRDRERLITAHGVNHKALYDLDQAEHRIIDSHLGEP